MTEEQYKKELFEFDEKPRKRFLNLRDFENRFLITLTPERLVFITIGIIMLMVVVFALGVERGKGIGRASGEKVVVTVAKPAPAAVKPATTLKPAPIKVTKPAPSVVTPAAHDAAKPFTIIAVTLTRSDTANAEASRLKREGFSPFVYQSGPYYQVSVGAFANKESAQATLTKVRQLYKDAYLKLR